MIEPLLTIKDMSNLMRRSTEAIRKDLQRQAWDRICPPLRLRSRLYWRNEDVQAWLSGRAQAQGVAQAPAPAAAIQQQQPRRRPGRPRKEKQR